MLQNVLQDFDTKRSELNGVTSSGESLKQEVSNPKEKQQIQSKGKFVACSAKPLSGFTMVNNQENCRWNFVLNYRVD